MLSYTMYRIQWRYAITIRDAQVRIFDVLFSEMSPTPVKSVVLILFYI